MRKGIIVLTLQLNVTELITDWARVWTQSWAHYSFGLGKIIAFLQMCLALLEQWCSSTI